MHHIQIALALAAGPVSARAQPADAQGAGSIEQEFANSLTAMPSARTSRTAVAALHKNGGQRP